MKKNINEAGLQNKIGFAIPETNFVDAHNPPDSGGGDAHDPNSDLPNEPVELTNEEVINNHLLSHGAHANWLKEQWSETMIEKKSVYAIGAIIIGYMILS